MDNENHKNTWNNFTKFVIVGNCRGYWCFSFNGNILTIRLMYENCFFSENQKIEKRVAITPEIAKKYISLGFEVSLSENYGKSPWN
jgi:hypothetical protein